MSTVTQETFCRIWKIFSLVLFCFLKYNFHFIVFPGNSISLVFKDLAPYVGFGGGRGAAPAGLNRGGGVRSFRASRERLLTTLL